MKKDLLTSLFALWQRMAGAQKNGGMLERYNWFLNNSEYKEDCAYTLKCQDLFLKLDYEEVKTLFLECLSEFRKVEGDSFGR